MASSHIANGDPGLQAVIDFLREVYDLQTIVGEALRDAFDEVIDCPRTGRYSLSQLEKTEKTYIGTKVEIVLRTRLGLERGKVLDNRIAGQEVDTKFSLGLGWMIPREAVGHICLLVSAGDLGKFSLGIARAAEEILTRGSNQDKKRSISRAGREHIYWICRNESMEKNFLAGLDEATRSAILSPKYGKQRVQALFRHATSRLIPRSVVMQVAQLDGDPLKRAREAKAILAPHGYRILCARYMSERPEFDRRFPGAYRKDDWMSLRIG